MSPNQILHRAGRWLLAAALAMAGGSSTQAVVYPYSFTISAALQQGLHIAVKDRLGKRATLQLVASTAYGEELIYKRDAPPPSARDRGPA